MRDVQRGRAKRSYRTQANGRIAGSDTAVQPNGRAQIQEPVRHQKHHGNAHGAVSVKHTRTGEIDAVDRFETETGETKAIVVRRGRGRRPGQGDGHERLGEQTAAVRRGQRLQEVPVQEQRDKTAFDERRVHVRGEAKREGNRAKEHPEASVFERRAHVQDAHVGVDQGHDTIAQDRIHENVQEPVRPAGVRQHQERTQSNAGVQGGRCSRRKG